MCLLGPPRGIHGSPHKTNAAPFTAYISPYPPSILLLLLHSMPHSVNESTHTMSRPSSTSTSSANAFPRQAGATLLAPEPLPEQRSPSRSTFSFESSPKSVQGSDRAVLFDDLRNTRPASRGAQKLSDAAAQPGNAGSRRRAQFYEEQFAYKEDTTSSARERVTKDAPIVAELRTNVIVCLQMQLPA